MTDTQSVPRTEQFEIAGDHLLSKVREVAHEGNVRRIILKNEEGHTLIEIPFMAGVAVTVLVAALAPAFVAVGAIAALVTRVTVIVERDD